MICNIILDLSCDIVQDIVRKLSLCCHAKTKKKKNQKKKKHREQIEKKNHVKLCEIRFDRKTNSAYCSAKNLTFYMCELLKF